MDDLIDMIVADESPSDISDTIKQLLFAKSAENIESIRPIVANSMFGNQEESEEDSENNYEEQDYEEE